MSLNQLKARMAKQKLAKLQREKDEVQRLALLAQVKDNLAEDITPVAVAVAEAIAPTAAVAEGLAPAPLASKPNVQLGKHEVDVSMFNAKQMLAVRLAGLGKTFCLIGAAGSGKTTCTRGVITTLKDNGIIGRLHEGTDKVLRTNAPSVAVLSYTNQAVRNIKEALPKEFKQHCSTIHKILEYQPEYEEVEELDDEGNWTGAYKKKMYYEPRYGIEPSTGHGKGETLPHLDVVIVEEAGSVPLDLWDTFLSALPAQGDDTIFIYLGDLNQLPPVFGDGILGYNLLHYPIVELTEVYRNVGLVTRFAHRILEGKPISCKELAEKWNISDESGTLTFNAFKKQIDAKTALPTLGKHFMKLVMEGKFDENHDVLLVPFNKQVGTIGMNKWLSHGIDKRDNRVVHEVLAGYIKSYWAVGDKVLFNKQYCIITDIERNTKFFGKDVLQPSTHLDRWGRTGREYEFRSVQQQEEEDLRTVEEMMDDAHDDLEEEGTIKASSILTLEATDEGLRDNMGELPTYEVVTAGQINGLLPVLAMSVHKSQGSEWRKVWMILHHTHAVMFRREMLYTGHTRARRDLEVFYSGSATTHKIGGSPYAMGIINQEIEGTTIEQKLKYFKTKVMAARISESIKAGKGIPKDDIQPTVINTEADLAHLESTVTELERIS